MRANLLVFALFIASTLTAQCPTPKYASVFPFPFNADVGLTVDYTGATRIATATVNVTTDSSNPRPKFILLDRDPASNFTVGALFQAGATDWDANGNNNASGVVLHADAEVRNDPTRVNWIISTAWPKATITYLDSAGNSRTFTMDASSRSASTVAVTSFYPDYTPSGTIIPKAHAALTLINTNGSYPVGNQTFPTWDRNAPGFGAALQQVGKHEAGHGFNLDDKAGVANDIMSFWGTSAADPSGAINNRNGHASSTITECDQIEVRNSPGAGYIGSGGSGGSGDDGGGGGGGHGGIDACSCGFDCANHDGGCCNNCDPEPCDECERPAPASKPVRVRDRLHF